MGKPFLSSASEGGHPIPSSTASTSGRNDNRSRAAMPVE